MMLAFIRFGFHGGGGEGFFCLLLFVALVCFVAAICCGRGGNGRPPRDMWPPK